LEVGRFEVEINVNQFENSRAIMSRLTIYFEDSEFESHERYVIFGSLDFLASAGETTIRDLRDFHLIFDRFSGGVLGLFM
jgi:hypothetical protein